MTISFVAIAKKEFSLPIFNEAASELQHLRPPIRKPNTLRCKVEMWKIDKEKEQILQLR